MRTFRKLISEISHGIGSWLRQGGVVSCRLPLRAERF
jgi:hypothetical protein